jgi:ribonuclease D
LKEFIEKIELHKGDLPAGIDFGDSVAIDTETMGLRPERDKLCLIQLSAGDGVCHLVQVSDGNYAAPNLKALLTDEKVTKIFHFARFDVAMLRRYLGIDCSPVYCTKIASRLVRTYTDSHGLKNLCQEILGVQLSKVQQSSDWGSETLSDEQVHYAALDVLYLHRLRDCLDEMLMREGRKELAQACFDFLSVRADLDLGGWRDEDIFAH